MNQQGGTKLERKRLAVQLPSGFAELAYTVHEAPKSRHTVLCLPDFLGNSADFSRLAVLLAGHGFRVICPDLPGRGDSAYLNPAEYNPHTYLLSLVSLVHSVAARRIAVVGKGWGAVLALGLAQTPEVSVSRLVLADLGVPWKLQVDDAVAEAARGPGFTALDEARGLLATSTDFRGLSPKRALSLIDGRLRQNARGYTLNFDPALLSAEAIGRFGKVSTPRLFAGVKARMLYMSAGPVSLRDRARLRSVLSETPGGSISVAANLTKAPHVHLVSDHELLLTLGFLLNRLPLD